MENFIPFDELEFVLDENGEKIELESGNFGNVYEGEYEGSKVRIIQSHDFSHLVGFMDDFEAEEMNTELYTRRILMEGDLMTKARHKNIVFMYGVCKEEGKVYLVTEYIDGANTLTDLVDEMQENLIKVNLKTKVSIARDILYGLKHLHSMDILHRNIRTSSILVTNERKAKIGWFAYAIHLDQIEEERKEMEKEIDPNDENALWERMYSKPPNVIPEDVHSKKSDVYCFGQVLGVLLLEEAFETFAGFFDDVFDNYNTEDDEILRELAAVTKRCRLKDPEKRPSVQELIKIVSKIYKKRELAYHAGFKKKTSDNSMEKLKESMRSLAKTMREKIQQKKEKMDMNDPMLSLEKIKGELTQKEYKSIQKVVEKVQMRRELTTRLKLRFFAYEESESVLMTSIRKLDLKKLKTIKKITKTSLAALSQLKKAREERGENVPNLVREIVKEFEEFFGTQKKRESFIKKKKKIQYLGELTFDSRKKCNRGIEYYMNGKVKFIGSFNKEGKRDGSGIEFEDSENPKIRLQGTWKNGKIQHFLSDEIPTIDYNTIAIIDTVGYGQEGIVYRVKVSGFKFKDKILAMKQMRDCEDAELQKECSIMCSVNHENIVNFIAWFQKKLHGKNGFVMEYCELGSVKNLIKVWERGKEELKYDITNWNNKMSILYQTARAMEFLNECSIVLLDLKWDNVLLNQFGGVRVCDFGRSIQIKTFVSLMHDTIRGSVFYISPEIVNRSWNEKNAAKCDVFSFGIMIFCILAMTTNPFAISLKDIQGPSDAMKFCEKYADDPDYRPSFDNFKNCSIDDEHLWIVKLMVRCWQGLSEERPSFSQIMQCFEDNL